ncbi:MAG TPA: efflux RND transporter periplasmic adaptor subunit [Candidatus Aminicenantes bacterium]|nr:efflux RND transporter periplasmic adaptor subunit [Candidatus Aminicenantes bacterium]
MMVSVIFFSWLIGCRQTAVDEKQASAEVAPNPVRVISVAREEISEKLTYTGIIEAWQQVNVTPEIAGKVARIYVNEGDLVQKGQLLAELDTRALDLQLKQAEAALAVAEANRADAQRNFERMKRLIAEKAVSEQQYEKIKLAYDTAEAQWKQAQASLNLVRHNLEVSKMKAPFSGVVASRNADVGDVINPMMGGFSPNSGVLTLIDYCKVKIKIEVSQSDIVRIKKKQRAYVRIDTYPQRQFAGEVAIVNQTADPLSKKFRVEVWASNPELLLKPNTFCQVIIEVNTHPEAIVVPQEAVVEDKYVFVIESGVAHRREVQLGLQNTEKVEILSGLQPGELVVVEGTLGLADGAKVKIEGERP